MLVILNVHFLWAQNSNITFEHFNVEQGLSSSDITCIFQDKTGYLWFGSYGAIDRFDGYQFFSYKHDPGNKNSLGNAFISKIYEDKKGNFWVGTSLGLDKFNSSSGTFTHFTPQPFSKIEWSNNVLSIYEDKFGILWVGTGNGLNIFDRATNKFTTFLYDSSDPGSLTHNSVGAICEDKSGTLWIGTGGGLDKLDRKANKFIHIWQNPDIKNGNIENWLKSEYWINVIFNDDSGTLWLGTNNGLVEINEKNIFYLIPFCKNFLHTGYNREHRGKNYV